MVRQKKKQQEQEKRLLKREKRRFRELQEERFGIIRNLAKNEFLLLSQKAFEKRQ